MNNLTLIIPTKNEKESLPIFLQEIKDYKCKKVIIIDNKDTDTENYIKDFKDIEIITQKKTGYGNALIEGINLTKTEYCCIINADGSMDPKYLSTKLKLCTDCDFVFSSRYLENGGSDDDDIITFIGNSFFSFIGKFFFSLNINDILYTYILAKTSAIKNLKLESNDFRICVELPIKAKRCGYRIETVASHERSRIGGIKKVKPFRDGFLILFKLFQLYFKRN
jgi:glycosyltransferase involved in cell wall biosynthesis